MDVGTFFLLLWLLLMLAAIILPSWQRRREAKLGVKRTVISD